MTLTLVILNIVEFDVWASGSINCQVRAFILSCICFVLSSDDLKTLVIVEFVSNVSGALWSKGNLTGFQLVLTFGFLFLF
jgi:glucose uptake protein GlcU